MTGEMIFLIILLIIMFIALIKEVAQPAFIVFAIVMILLLTGIISADEALRGFSNEGMITIGLLFIVAGAVGSNPLLYQFIQKIMGGKSGYRKVILRMMVPVSTLSAFLNNTPIVVTMVPIIRKWCRDHDISPSKLLIPLSYGAIFGGMITLVGTSTNLVVHGLMLDNGMEGFSMFQLAIVGVPGAFLGILYLVLFGDKLLPGERRTLEESFEEKSRDYITAAHVESSFPYIGKTLKEVNLKGLFLIEIIRDGKSISPVLPREKIFEGDRLHFSGNISTIGEINRMKGLSLASDSVKPLEGRENLKLVEAVVSNTSNLLRKTIKESDIRNKYNATVVAIQKYNMKHLENMGDTKLHTGDILLLLVNDDFTRKWETMFVDDFYIVSEVSEAEAFTEKQTPLKTYFPIFMLVLMVALVALNITTMFKAALAVTFLFIVFKIVESEKIAKYIDFQVLLLIACSFGIGIAIEGTGLATLIADNVIKMTGALGIIGIISVLYIITNIFTELITNTAAAVIMFPIALQTADMAAIDPIALIVPVTIGASASFITPIGYQTNLIVYSQGGYKYTDFMKVGIPLSLIYLIVTVVMVYFFVL